MALLYAPARGFQDLLLTTGALALISLLVALALPRDRPVSSVAGPTERALP